MPIARTITVITQRVMICTLPLIDGCYIWYRKEGGAVKRSVYYHLHWHVTAITTPPVVSIPASYCLLSCKAINKYLLVVKICEKVETIIVTALEVSICWLCNWPADLDKPWNRPWNEWVCWSVNWLIDFNGWVWILFKSDETHDMLCTRCQIIIVVCRT